MSIIKLKAKVKLISEDDMEIESDIELTNFKSARWVWRQMAFSVTEIYRLVGYTSDKTLIIFQDGEKLLVKETFEELYKLWTENLEEDLILGDEGVDEDFEISGEEE